MDTKKSEMEKDVHDLESQGYVCLFECDDRVGRCGYHCTKKENGHTSSRKKEYFGFSRLWSIGWRLRRS